jgi:hypothetical protein
MWSNSAGLGGGITDLTAAANQDGRLEVFAIGSDGGLNHIWQTVANGGWSAGPQRPEQARPSYPRQTKLSSPSRSPEISKVAPNLLSVCSAGLHYGLLSSEA